MLSMEDGLPTRMIFDVLQDREGFMWFATANGLCRYDGNSFKIFNSQNAPFLNNTITGLALDSKNHLFIESTINFGSDYSQNAYQVLDLNTYQFIKLNEAFPNMPFKENEIKLMCHDELGSIFFLTDKPCKLWQYNNVSSFTLRTDFSNAIKDNASISPANCVMKSVNNCVLIFFARENLSYFICPRQVPYSIKYNPLSSAIIENKQYVFFDDKLKSYQVIDSMGKQSALSDTTTLSTKNWSLVNFNAQSQLLKSSDYNYYLLKENQYIEIFNPIEQKGLGYFGVHSYYEDINGNYWFCTDKGIYQVNIRKHQFEHLFTNTQSNKIGTAPVRAIYVDHNQTGEKRILAMVDFRLRIKEKDRITSSNIGSTTLLKKKDWLYAAGYCLLTKYNLATSKNIKYPLLNMGDIWSVADFSDSLVLIGGSSGILSFNTYTNVSIPIQYLHKNIPPPVNVYRIIKTTKGWIAVAENGIYFIDDHAVVYDYYGKDQRQPDKRLPFTGIFDCYEDKESIVWLAMNGDGLVRWNWNTHHPMDPHNFKKFTVENGLIDNILYRIEEDNANNLWISSYSGLVKFNNKTYSTKIYRTKDGLVNTEFNRISSFKDYDGWMYFGGQNGIDAFDPAKMNDDSKESSVPFKLVGLSKFSAIKDTVVDISNELKLHNEIIMNVGDKFLSVFFSLLDYQSRTHRYAYRIDGLDKDWNYVNENVIRISSLPYGKLTLRIKAQLESGNWNTTVLLIPIQVIKPFYLESLFIIVACLFFMLIVYLFFLLRSRKFKKDTIILEQKVQQRTESLNKALSEKELLLTEIHHRVKNNLQVISGLLELRKSGIEDERGMAAFSESQSGIMNIAMIHELLYQNENTGRLEFHFILNNIISNVTQLFGNENKKIIFEVPPNKFVFNINTSVTLGLILNELLTNAFKYLPPNQRNTVSIKIEQVGNHSYRLVFQDNGPGLPKGVDFHAADSIGFSIIKSLVMQLHGTIAYSYEQGSMFVLDFEDNTASG